MDVFCSCSRSWPGTHLGLCVSSIHQLMQTCPGSSDVKRIHFTQWIELFMADMPRSFYSVRTAKSHLHEAMLLLVDMDEGGRRWPCQRFTSNADIFPYPFGIFFTQLCLKVLHIKFLHFPLMVRFLWMFMDIILNQQQLVGILNAVYKCSGGESFEFKGYLHLDAPSSRCVPLLESYILHSWYMEAPKV